MGIAVGCWVGEEAGVIVGGTDVLVAEGGTAVLLGATDGVTRGRGVAVCVGSDCAVGSPVAVGKGVSAGSGSWVGSASVSSGSGVSDGAGIGVRVCIGTGVGNAVDVVVAVEVRGTDVGTDGLVAARVAVLVPVRVGLGWRVCVVRAVDVAVRMTGPLTRGLGVGDIAALRVGTLLGVGARMTTVLVGEGLF